MNRSFTVVALVLAVFTLSCSVASIGSVGVSSLILRKTGKDLIQDAQETGNALIGQAERSGNAVAARVGNELLVSAEVLEKRLAGDLDLQVKNIRTEHAKLLVQLAEANETARRFVPGAFALKDSAVLDVRAVIGDSILAPRDVYYLQRINGITQLEKPFGGDYKLEIMGIGFGIDSDRARHRILEVAITQEGQPPLPLHFTENKVHAFLSELRLPNRELAAHFAPRTLSLIPIRIKSEASVRGTLKGWSTPREYETRFFLSLLPKHGATLTVSYEHPVYGWIPQPERKYFDYVTVDHNQNKDVRHFDYVVETKAEVGYRFAAARIDAKSGEGCAYLDDSTPPRGLRVTDGGKRLVLNVSVWGSPCTFQYSVALEKEEVVSSVVDEQTVDADYGRLVTLSLPREVTFWAIVGKTATLDDIELVNETSTDILKFVDRRDTGKDQRVTYRLLPPEGSYYSLATK